MELKLISKSNRNISKFITNINNKKFLKSRKPDFVNRYQNDVIHTHLSIPIKEFPHKGMRSNPKLSGRVTQAFYLTLHRIGFVKPWLLPLKRWALTSPFHPYLSRRRYIFCDTIRRSSLKNSALSFKRNSTLWCPDFPLVLIKNKRVYTLQKPSISMSTLSK